jgi:hypothetical protein
MGVTELALLQLEPGVSIHDTTLRQGLLAAKKAMESFTGNEFYLYHDLEHDPRFIYIIGTWASVAQHWDEWIPSEANQQLLALLAKHVRVHWMFHISIESEARIPVESPLLVVTRYPVCLKDKFRDATSKLQAGRMVGGWRIEKGAQDDQKDEWVLFSGWQNVDEFNQSKAVLDELRETAEKMEDADRCWARLELELEL